MNQSSKPNHLWVVAESPGCQLANEWRKAFSQLPAGIVEVNWMFLSRPMEFWRRRRNLPISGEPPQVVSLGWFATILTHLCLPRNISLLPANIPNQNAPFLSSILKRSTAQIRLPASPSPRNHSTSVSNGFQLVCVADMVAGSGAMEALWAFTMVRLAGWPCTLWMAGEGPLLEEFRSFANLASIPEDIRFVPNFRSEESFPVKADLVIVPNPNWKPDDSLLFESSTTQITSSDGDAPSKLGLTTNPTRKIISIPWKPHHICRVIMESLSALDQPGVQPPFKGHGKDLVAVLRAATKGKRPSKLDMIS